MIPVSVEHASPSVSLSFVSQRVQTWQLHVSIPKLLASALSTDLARSMATHLSRKELNLEGSSSRIPFCTLRQNQYQGALASQALSALASQFSRQIHHVDGSDKAVRFLEDLKSVWGTVDWLYG